MTVIFLIILSMLRQIISHEQNKFLIDYFVFKKVSYVVVFSCCNINQEKVMLLKTLNKFGIGNSFPPFNSDSSIIQSIVSKYKKIGVFVNVSCFDENTLDSLFKKATDRRLYYDMHNWLILANNSLSQTVNLLDEYGLGTSTDLVIAVANIDGYQLYDVYNPWKEGGGQISITHLGSWNYNFGLRIIVTQSKIKRRCNLHGLLIRSYFFRSIYRPKNMTIDEYMRDYSFGFKDGLSKFGYSLVVHLSEMYNFTLQFGEIKKWLPGDSLGPMSRALVQNEMQITGSPVIISEERLRLTKFVYPAWPFRTCFVFRNPQSQVIKVGEVLHPFADETWHVTLVAGFTIFVILAFSLKQETYTTLENIWSKSLLITVGCLCQQGTHFNLEKISTRIVFINLMILSYLVYNYYNAAVMSTKINEPIFKINDSVNELGKFGFKMASESMNYFEFIFTRLSEWERKVFYEDRWLKIPEAERFMKPEEAIPLVQKGGFAYHSHPDVIYPIIDRTFSSREICELMEVHPLVPRYSTLSVSYNSTFVELAKIGLSRMTEVGIRHRQIRRWTSRKPVCNRDETSIESVDIYEFAPHLMLLAIGMTMATVVFTFELVSVNYWRNQEW